MRWATAAMLIEAKIEAIVDDLAKAQLPDGYLNAGTSGASPTSAGRTFATTMSSTTPATCWRARSPISRLRTPQVARHHGALRRPYRRDVRPRPGQKRGYPGHQEIEIALIKLYRLTGDRKHLDLATYFINERGHQPPHYFAEEALARATIRRITGPGPTNIASPHLPVREQTKVVGHAVRAMYMDTAMADLAAELNDAGLKRACEALWDDVTTAQMYVTAGLGPEDQRGFHRLTTCRTKPPMPRLALRSR